MSERVVEGWTLTYVPAETWADEGIVGAGTEEEWARLDADGLEAGREDIIEPNVVDLSIVLPLPVLRAMLEMWDERPVMATAEERAALEQAKALVGKDGG